MPSNDAERIAAIEDPYQLLRVATERLNAAQQEVTELSRLRRRVIQELHAQGMSYAQIAKEAGLTRGRIHQIRHTGPAPEGAFFGQGTITLITPLKREARQARPVVAVEDVAAAKRLEDLARGFDLAVELEHVPLGGDVNLNRPNLVVICGPRLSTVMGELYERDPVLEWVKEDVWTLHDTRTDERYRSGSDDEPARPIDYAYLGRLPRPDGAGHVLVFTGIHPQGTLGVVRLLQTELAALWGRVADKPFSTVVSTEYEPESGEPVKVELASPLYRHQEG
ncbi:sigma-70 family RNA polymerase sigma factor [Nonomuraea sp. MCN248]|uniref:Sigma-70 family RNA polymerase sigma factor n=1 Tax=Nonomuraea corallina TaxID=2989783 RepID=A0ABT4S4D6_9ACTN|nr:sigma factor-like helix-turn-helix DNA-binding protein [Nonomuraea corallina]MDA0631880.1 sigma-70 family RNA polymerase sigma factor [Nonomuraea corallina]